MVVNYGWYFSSCLKFALSKSSLFYIFYIYIYCFYNHEQEKKCFYLVFSFSRVQKPYHLDRLKTQRFPVSSQANNELMLSYMRPRKRQNYDLPLFSLIAGKQDYVNSISGTIKVVPRGSLDSWYLSSYLSRLEFFFNSQKMAYCIFSLILQQSNLNDDTGYSWRFSLF